MGYNGSGTWVRLYNWVQDKTNGIGITASRMDGDSNDFAGGFSLAVTRDGQGQMAANFNPSADNTYSLGNASFRWTGINSALSFNANNQVTVNAATGANTSLTVSGPANQYAETINGNSTSGQSYGMVISAGTTSADIALNVRSQSGGANFLEIYGNGESITYTPTTTVKQAAGAYHIGYLDEPQNLQNANYGLVFTDRSKQIYHNSATAHTWTIPANASVAYPIGTIIRLINRGTGAVTLAITTDTLVWCPSGSTGSRTLSQYATASIEKVEATIWTLTGGSIS